MHREVTSCWLGFPFLTNNFLNPWSIPFKFVRRKGIPLFISNSKTLWKSISQVFVYSIRCQWIKWNKFVGTQSLFCSLWKCFSLSGTAHCGRGGSVIRHPMALSNLVSSLGLSSTASCNLSSVPCTLNGEKQHLWIIHAELWSHESCWVCNEQMPSVNEWNHYHMMQASELHLPFSPRFQSMFHLMGKARQSSMVGPSKLSASEQSIPKATARA